MYNSNVTQRTVIAGEDILELRILDNGQMDIYHVAKVNNAAVVQGRVAYSTVLTTGPDNPGTVGNDGSIGSMNVLVDTASGSTYTTKADYISSAAMIFTGSENLRLDATPSLGSIRLAGDIIQNKTVHSIPVNIVLTNP